MAYLLRYLHTSNKYTNRTDRSKSNIQIFKNRGSGLLYKIFEKSPPQSHNVSMSSEIKFTKSCIFLFNLSSKSYHLNNYFSTLIIIAQGNIWYNALLYSTTVLGGE